MPPLAIIPATLTLGNLASAFPAANLGVALLAGTFAALFVALAREPQRSARPRATVRPFRGSIGAALGDRTAA